MDVEALNRELTAINMVVPVNIAAALRREQQRHLAGELGESREAIEERRLLIRRALLRLQLDDVRPVLNRAERG